jgi:hypothetical protein
VIPTLPRHKLPKHHLTPCLLAILIYHLDARSLPPSFFSPPTTSLPLYSAS